MINMVLIEEQRFNRLYMKIEQLHEAIIKNKGGDATNEVNGFISEKEAIKLLGRSQTWFWRKRNEGFLPFKKMGSAVFYEKNQLFNLLEEA